MRWGILGSQGLLGSELVRYLASRGEQVVPLNRKNFKADWSESDIEECLDSYSLDVVINTIAYTNVDLAEASWREALEVNGNLPAKLAVATERLRLKFFHISTDYVFSDATLIRHPEMDLPSPATAYGKSKFIGEQRVLEFSHSAQVVRTAWLYGSTGRCFPKVISQLIDDKNTVEVVCDQFGSPTWTADVAEFLYLANEMKVEDRVLHAVSQGEASWFEFALAIAGAKGLDPESVVFPVKSSQYSRPAPRPKFSILQNTQPNLKIENWLSRWNLASESVLR